MDQQLYIEPPPPKKSDTPQDFYDQGKAAERRDDLEAAVGFYKNALAKDPSFGKAISALGRLQYIEPDHPFWDEFHRRFDNKKLCEVNVAVRNPCNYRCFYCVAKGANNTPVQLFDLKNIENIYQEIKADVIISAFECDGGEPTVHPQFPELIRLCSKYGVVSFPTNNSQNPERWLPKETASRLLVRSALHPEAEPKLDQYLAYAKYLLNAGCEFFATYISHPTRIAKIPEYRKIFAEHGIPFSPVCFIGEYEGRYYPHAHSQEEKEIIGVNDSSRYWPHRLEPHAARIRNFRGIPCQAGARTIYITHQGILRRCLYDHAPIASPFDKAQPCGVKRCGCGMFLEKLHTLNNNYNYWASKSGKEPIDESGLDEYAVKLGYASRDDAMFTEGLKIYEMLMSAYGKNEFPEPFKRPLST